MCFVLCSLILELQVHNSVICQDQCWELCGKALGESHNSRNISTYIPVAVFYDKAANLEWRPGDSQLSFQHYTLYVCCLCLLLLEHSST